MTQLPRHIILVLLAGTLGLSACTSPVRRDHSADLRTSIIEAIKRDLGSSESSAPNPAAPQVSRVEALGLPADVIIKHDQTSGPESYRLTEPVYSPTLDGGAQRAIKVSLLRTIITTADNNLTLQFARLVPAMGQARTAAAEAAFDWTLFVNTQFQNQNNATQRTSGFGTQPQLNEEMQYQATAGLRIRLESGASLVFQHQATHSDLSSPGLFPSPNPANTLNIVAQIDQPLLRNFGSDAALAEVRLAANAERDNIQQLKATLIQQLVEAETAYWQLVRAEGELKIAQRLLERGIEVSDTLKKRQITAKDVRASQISDAVATVEARRSDVLRAENALRSASDRLKGIMNEPEISVGGELLLLPVDQPMTEPLQFTLMDVLTTALANRPEVQRALLAISDANIRRQLADNARLPVLDLRLQTRISELRDNIDTAYSKIDDLNFIDYLVGVNYEQPIGNRAAEAAFRGRELELMQSRITYREVVQRVLLDVKSSLRSVVTNVNLIEQSRASRIAAAENLNILEVEEKTIQLLTPEFLDLKLRRQQALAAAEAQELAALAEYNTAIARLYGSMGTTLEHNRINFSAPDNPELR